MHNIGKVWGSNPRREKNSYPNMNKIVQPNFMLLVIVAWVVYELRSSPFIFFVEGNVFTAFH